MPLAAGCRRLDMVGGFGCISWSGGSHNPLPSGRPRSHHGVMMTLHYTGGSVLMADDVCEAVIQYARVLAASQSSDVLVVPVIDEDGALVTAELLVGPASQLLAVPVSGAPESGRDQSVIDDIERRTRLLDSPASVTRLSRDALPPFDHDMS